MSESLTLLYGVPRRSLLGPVLFAVYVSSLASLHAAPGASCYSYADITQLDHEIKRFQDVKDKIVALFWILGFGCIRGG